MAEETSELDLDAVSRVVGDGPWAGWRCFGDADPFEALTGPYYFRVDADGRMYSAFRAERKHMNGGGFMHGGCLLTFADFALFMIAHQHEPNFRGVTATLNGEFIGAVSAGDMVEAEGEVIRAGRSLIFVRGLIRAAEKPVMSFSGVIKRVGSRTPPAP